MINRELLYKALVDEGLNSLELSLENSNKFADENIDEVEKDLVEAYAKSVWYCGEAFKDKINKAKVDG